MRGLSSLVYDYDCNDHGPSVGRLLWGNLILFARLKSMSIEYTLFEPSGDPLRANVKLAFVGFMSDCALASSHRDSPPRSRRAAGPAFPPRRL